MKNSTLFILLFLSLKLFAQQISVIDFDTKLPIQDCTIYGESDEIFLLTDKEGKVNITDFKTNEVIYFNHVSYVEIEILKRNINKNLLIELHKKSEPLNEVILSVSRQKESKSRIAEIVETNKLLEIERKAPPTSADLLASFSGVKVQKTQSGGGSPVLRGMEANRVLLVVDGVRMNNAIYRMGHLQNSITVSPSILERTEVLFGPSSVAYGSDALGGVIHYFTKTPSTSENTEVQINLMSRYATINDEFTNHGSAEISNKKWASLTSFSVAKFGDIKMGKNRNHGFDDWGKVFEYSNNTDDYYNPSPVINQDPNIQKNTEYSQYDFLQKFNFELSEATNLLVNFQLSNSTNIPRFDRLTEYKNNELKFAEWYYGPQQRTLLSTQLNINSNKKWVNNGSIIAAYQKIKESRINRRFDSLDRSYRKENVDVYTLSGDFQAQLSKNSNRNLTYGFELAHNEVGSNSYGKTIAVNGNEIIGFSGDFTVQSRYPDGGSSYTSAAIYGGYRQDINEKSTLNTGLRLTNTHLHAKWIDDTFITLPDDDIYLHNTALTATIGYVYKPTESWQINSVLSSGFRSPNIDDIGKIREKNGQVTVPNIYLKPEYAYSAEISALKYLNDKKFNVGLNIYYTLLNNYIAREPYEINGSPTIIYDGEELETFANVNHNNAYIMGSTLSFNGRLSERYSTRGSITLTKGHTYDTDIPLSSIPPLFGNLEVEYSKNKFYSSINYRFNGKKSIEDYNLVEGIDNEEQTPIDPSTGDYYGTPSWSSLDFNSGYKISQVFAVQFMVNNLFDNHYKEFASAISSPGRNFVFSILLNN